MKRLSCILQNRVMERPEPHRIAWLGAGTLLLSLWMANAGVASQPPAPGRATLNQQLLARAAEASVADVEKLIRRGAQVNVQDRFGVTPLMEAVIGNNRAVVRVLLDAGASVGIRNLRGDTALDLARELGRREIEQLLLQAHGSRVNPRLLTRHGNWR